MIIYPHALIRMEDNKLKQEVRTIWYRHYLRSILMTICILYLHMKQLHFHLITKKKKLVSCILTTQKWQ
jgi:hypothetical protein